MGDNRVISLERNLFNSEIKDKTKNFRVSERMDKALSLVSDYYGRKPSELITSVMDQFLQGQLKEVPGLEKLLQDTEAS